MPNNDAIIEVATGRSDDGTVVRLKSSALPSMLRTMHSRAVQDALRTARVVCDQYAKMAVQGRATAHDRRGRPVNAIGYNVALLLDSRLADGFTRTLNEPHAEWFLKEWTRRVALFARTLDANTNAGREYTREYNTTTGGQ